MFRVALIIVLLFVLTSLILQIISLLSNFNGLRSVYIARIDFDVNAGNMGGNIFQNIWDTTKSSILGDKIPQYFTLGLFVLCEGTSSNQTICSPSSFGYNYNSVGLLESIESKIPSYAHSVIAKIQQGVFIPSVVLCFILLCYSLYYICSGREHGICNYIIIELIATIAFLFCLATFIIQYIAYSKIKNGINDIKSTLFGDLINDFVIITPSSGKSIWLSLAASILLFLACVFLLFSFCTGRKYRKRRNQPESYEMGQV